MSEIENFHAHVYSDAPTRAQAEKLCAAAGQKFGVKVGRMHDNPVGPHPRGSCQLTIGKEQFTDVVSWLVLNRRGLTGVMEKTSLVHEGLRPLIARESARRLAALGGSEPALRPVPRRRASRGAQKRAR